MGRKPHPHHPMHDLRAAGSDAPESAAAAGGLPVEIPVEVPSPTAAGLPAEAPPAEPAVAPAEPAAELPEPGREAAAWKDRALRAAADLENAKKRAARERTETWGRAQADLMARMLDALDDLGRIAALDPAQTGAQALHEGAGLVERKLLKALEGVGLERVDPAGQAFDPNVHEAVTTMPAPSADADHQVGAVFQLGYRLNGVLLRPARVAVLVWSGPAGAAE